MTHGGEEVRLCAGRGNGFCGSLCQHLGTAKVGAVFGPVMITWFAVLATLGAWQVVRDPSVVRAVDPKVEFEIEDSPKGPRANRVRSA